MAERVKRFADKGQVIFFQGQLRYIAAEVMRLEPQVPDESFVPDVNIGNPRHSNALHLHPHEAI